MQTSLTHSILPPAHTSGCRNTGLQIHHIRAGPAWVGVKFVKAGEIWSDQGVIPRSLALLAKRRRPNFLSQGAGLARPMHQKDSVENRAYSKIDMLFKTTNARSCFLFLLRELHRLSFPSSYWGWLTSYSL
jgi:hypothetical protein